jgi:hypothetical protein
MFKLLLVLALGALAACGPRDPPDPGEAVVPSAAPRDSTPRADSLMAGDTARAP